MCWKLNGKCQPGNKGFNSSENKSNQAARSTQAYQTAIVEDSQDNFLNKENVERLKKLLLQLKDPTTSSYLVA